jgi:hypothetical protein
MRLKESLVQLVCERPPAMETVLTDW